MNFVDLGRRVQFDGLRCKPDAPIRIKCEARWEGKSFSNRRIRWTIGLVWRTTSYVFLQTRIGRSLTRVDRMKETFLNFHGIGEYPPWTDVAERNFWWDESPFLSALDCISAATCNSSAVFITFDDGNASDVTIALPALAKRGMTASFFVCAGRIGIRGYLDVAAIRDLLSAGMRIGNHGMHHRDWRKLNDAALDAEVIGAKKMLEDVCGTVINEVSIPFGSYDHRVLTKIRSENYQYAYTSDGGTVRHDRWLKTRNTLDRSWQWKDTLAELAARDSFVSCVRRAAVRRYKTLR